LHFWKLPRAWRNRRESAAAKHDELNRAFEFALVNLRNQLTTANSISDEIIQSRLLEIERWWYSQKWPL